MMITWILPDLSSTNARSDCGAREWPAHQCATAFDSGENWRPVFKDRAVQKEGTVRDALGSYKLRGRDQWRMNHERHRRRVVHAAGHESGNQALMLAIICIMVQVLVKLRRNGSNACEAESQLHQRQQGEASEDVTAKSRKHGTP